MPSHQSGKKILLVAKLFLLSTHSTLILYHSLHPPPSPTPVVSSYTFSVDKDKENVKQVSVVVSPSPNKSIQLKFPHLYIHETCIVSQKLRHALPNGLQLFLQNQFHKYYSPYDYTKISLRIFATISYDPTQLILFSSESTSSHKNHFNL